MKKIIRRVFVFILLFVPLFGIFLVEETGRWARAVVDFIGLTVILLIIAGWAWLINELWG